MAEEAGKNILVVDDNAGYRTALSLVLADAGHEVVAEAGDLDELANVLDSLEVDEVDVVLLDGRIEPGAQDATDGENAIEMIREKGFLARILGISATDQLTGIESEDNVGKDYRVILGKIAEMGAARAA